MKFSIIFLFLAIWTFDTCHSFGPSFKGVAENQFLTASDGVEESYHVMKTGTVGETTSKPEPEAVAEAPE